MLRQYITKNKARTAEIPAKKAENFFREACWILPAALVILSLVPKPVVGYFLHSEGEEALCHALAYSVLAFLLGIYFRFKRSFLSLRMTLPAVLLVACALCALLGAFTELIQVFSPGRVPDLADFYDDMIGTAGGLFTFLVFRKLPLTRRLLENPPAAPRLRAEHP